MEHEYRVAARERLRPGDAPALLVGAAIPDDHSVRPTPALEGVVRRAVVGDLDGEALDGRVQRGPFGDRPRAHDPVELQAQVEMMRGRGVLLDDEHPGADAADRELLVG